MHQSLHRRLWILALTIAALLAQATTARAADPNTTEACVAAYGASQELRLEGRVSKALEQAELCAAARCPEVVRDGCTKWLVELRDDQPTVVFSAKSGTADLTLVKVYVDGALVMSELTGAPTPVDPGAHAIRFEHRNLVPIERTIVVAIGVKNREIGIVFDDPTPPASSARSGDDAAAEEPIAAYVLGAFGVAAIGVFAALAIVGTNEVQNLGETCGVTHSCTDKEVDAARTKIIVGDAFLAGGAVSLAVAVGLVIAHYVDAPSKDDTPDDDTAIRWHIASDGAGLTVAF